MNRNEFEYELKARLAGRMFPMSENTRHGIIRSFRTDQTETVNHAVQLQELMELGIALTDVFRGRGTEEEQRLALLEEMADVYNTLKALQDEYGIDDRTLMAAADTKLHRYAVSMGHGERTTAGYGFKQDYRVVNGKGQVVRDSHMELAQHLDIWAATFIRSEIEKSDPDSGCEVEKEELE